MVQEGGGGGGQLLFGTVPWFLPEEVDPLPVGSERKECTRRNQTALRVKRLGTFMGKVRGGRCPLSDRVCGSLIKGGLRPLVLTTKTSRIPTKEVMKDLPNTFQSVVRVSIGRNQL